MLRIASKSDRYLQLEIIFTPTVVFREDSPSIYRLLFTHIHDSTLHITVNKQISYFRRSVIFKSISPTHSCSMCVPVTLVLYCFYLMPHNIFPKLCEFHSLEAFCHKVSNHIVRRTIFDDDVAFFYLIRDHKITDV